MKRLWILFLILASGFNGLSQEREINLEQFAERLFQIQDEEISYEDIYESLLLYFTNKINLNEVEPEELNALYILSPIQVSNFFTYRDQFGKLLSIYELQAIPEFDVFTIRDLMPFVTVKESSLDTRPILQRIATEENKYLLLRYTRRLEQQKGYTAAVPIDTTITRNLQDAPVDTILSKPARYQGSPNKLYGRFRTSRRGDFSLGFTFEKDQGEAFSFSKKKKGFDFYSYHLQLENKLGFEKILLGDFQLQVGQGLLYGAGFGAGKGAETVNAVKRNTIGLRPYTSVLETDFFRGIGLAKKMGDFELTLFYSRLRQDGNVQSDTTVSDFEEFVNSIQNTGFHRTESEVSGKNQLVEKSIGGYLQYKPNRMLSIGVAGLNSTYSKPIQRKPNNYNQFEFSGTYNFLGSVYANYTWQNFTVFGEAARSKSGGNGMVGGIVGSLSTTIDFAMVLRNYEKDFHSFYGNAFSENSRVINEKGTYWGISIQPFRRQKINLYYDRFEFPWLRFGTEAPSIGHEWLGRYTFLPNRQVILYAQVRQQTRQVTIPQENLNKLVDQIRHNYLFNVDYQPQSWIQLRSKIQASTQQEGGISTKGFAIIQDLNIDIWELQFKTRAAIFETDDFDNAQYVYESDVLYAFSVPAYNGVGMRKYIMVRYDPARNISLWIRYAQTTFRDRDTVGSGLEESQGERSSEIKVMLRVNL